MVQKAIWLVESQGQLSFPAGFPAFWSQRVS
jgi:hypothetical protein